jgi:hypothetical protein
MGRRLIKTAVDVLLVFGLMAMVVTGMGLYFAPSGKIAKATNWTWLGLDKHTLGEVHTYFGFSMVIIGLIHLTLNWKPLASLLKSLNANKSDIAKVTATILILALGGVIYISS